MVKKNLLKTSIKLFLTFQIIQPIAIIAYFQSKNLNGIALGVIAGLTAGILNYIINPYNIKEDKKIKKVI